MGLAYNKGDGMGLAYPTRVMGWAYNKGDGMGLAYGGCKREAAGM